MNDFYFDKNIFITGCAGTIGKELIRQLIELKPKKIIAIDNNETELFFLMEQYKNCDNVNFFICDIRDKEKLKFVMHGCDFVFHAAALKHVILGEYNPSDIVKTNLIGLQNIIDAAIELNVKKVLFMSSDKAVNPTNAMGASKLMGERLITAANNFQDYGGTIFCSVRFGNVVGSRGSVIPVFLNQLKNGINLTITDVNMTRFLMKKEEAVNLILNSMKISQGAEIFILKMNAVKIIDLARVLITELSPVFNKNKIDMVFIGSKPGEKLFEELLSEEEANHSIEFENYYCVLPAFKSIYSHSFNYKYDEKIINKKIEKKITSNILKLLTEEEIKKYYIEYLKENINEFMQ
ncbi:MAG: SDR family NAD(P)-dependent oxidoreductase [Burkholderiales bacterium]